MATNPLLLFTNYDALLIEYYAFIKNENRDEELPMWKDSFWSIDEKTRYRTVLHISFKKKSNVWKLQGEQKDVTLCYLYGEIFNAY